MNPSDGQTELIAAESREAQAVKSGLDFAQGYGAGPSAALGAGAATALRPQSRSAVEVAPSQVRRAAAEPGAALRRWAPVLLKFVSVQATVQLLGLAAGILVVRNLPKREYAFYTLANSMLAMILLLADSGISSSLTAIGGRIWQDQRKLGSLVNTAMVLRRWMAAAIVAIVVPMLVWLLVRNGAGAFTTATVVSAVLVGCGFELITRIYTIVLRLKSEFRQIQRQALAGSLVKLAVVGVALRLYLNASIAIMAVAAGFAVQFLMLRRWLRGKIDTQAPADREMRREMVSVIRRQSFHSVHHCLETQITIWLISIFGSAENVANVGALARLAMLFSIFGAVTSDVVAPAFARLQSADHLWRRYWQIVGAYTLFCGCMVGLIMVFPRQALWILGHQYADLSRYGFLIAAGMMTAAVIDLLLALNTSRAWILPPLAYIPISIGIQATLVWLLNLATIRGVLILAILTDVPIILGQLLYAVMQMKKMQSAAA